MKLASIMGEPDPRKIEAQVTEDLIELWAAYFSHDLEMSAKTKGII